MNRCLLPVCAFVASFLTLAPVAAQSVGFLDAGFDPRNGPDGPILGAALEPSSNRLLIGGDFDNFGSTPRSAIAGLRGNGLIDATFDPGSGVNVPSSIDDPSSGRVDTLSRPGTQRSVQAVGYAPDGKIVLGGNFLFYDNVQVTHIVRLNANGSLDLTFRPESALPVDSLVIQPNVPVPGGSTTIETITNVESVLVAADLSVYVCYRAYRKTTVVIPDPASTTITEEYLSDLIHYERDGVLDTSFRVVIAGDIRPQIYRAALQPDGKILISGRFINVNGFPRPGIARLNADGTIDGSFSPTTGVLPELIYNFTQQPDGKFIVVGDFSSFDNALRRRIARILPDGTVDPTFDPGFAANAAIRQVAVVPSTGKILFAGDFTLFDGLARPGFARTNASGKVDATFNSAGELSGLNFGINAILPQNDGKVVVVGSFTRYGSVTRNRVLRLLADPTIGGGGGSGGGSGAARLSNVSTRGFVGTGDAVLIGGFSVATNNKRVLVRSMGPTLTSFGVSGALADPRLELRDAFGALVAENNDWQASADGGAEVTNAGLAPANAREAALVATLPPGLYTVVVRGVANSTGVALFEAYDVDGSVTNRLTNLSTRGQVLTNDRVLIGGFSVSGDSASDNRRVLVRGMGPTLASYNVAGTVSDPTLEIFDANGNLIGRNNNWQDTQGAEIQATGFQPQDAREAAVLLLLPAGNYTAVLRGVGGTTGVGLVEVYEVQ